MDSTDQPEPTAWEDIGARVPATVAPSMPPSTSSAAVDASDQSPDARKAFAAHLTPCLALTSGVGMGQQEQATWLRAAYQALDGVPLDLLQRGAAAAMRIADHPSKIVPAIMAEIGETWRARQRRQPPRPVALPAPVETEEEQAERAAVAGMLSDLARKLSASHPPARSSIEAALAPGSLDPARPCRAPTREDYLRMGVAPEVLDADALGSMAA